MKFQLTEHRILGQLVSELVKKTQSTIGGYLNKLMRIIFLNSTTVQQKR